MIRDHFLAEGAVGVFQQISLRGEFVEHDAVARLEFSDLRHFEREAADATIDGRSSATTSRIVVIFSTGWVPRKPTFMLRFTEVTLSTSVFASEDFVGRFDGKIIHMIRAEQWHPPGE